MMSASGSLLGFRSTPLLTPGGEVDAEARSGLEWELSELREAISEHGAVSARLYAEYDRLERDLLAVRDTDGWNRMRAERVEAARQRGEEMAVMRRREGELVAILGSDWA